MKIGIVGDIHLPFTHPLYLQFCCDIFEQWSVDHIHFIGDVVDLHALSFWDHDPDGMSASSESDQAAEQLEHWVDTFPKATVSIGNHDARHYRKAQKAGIPERFIKGYSDVWHSPGWDWKNFHHFDNVLYEHGTGSSGKDAAMNRAMAKRTSLVMGHVHSHGGAKYNANEKDMIFGLNVGCGIDCTAYAFAYGANFPSRPTLGCGVVIDGIGAVFEPMPCGKGQTYHRSKA